MVRDMLKFLTNREIYEQVILGAVAKAERQLWIATADIKDLVYSTPPHEINSLIEDELISMGVEKKLSKAPRAAARLA